jgi:hypothetical protein
VVRLSADQSARPSAGSKKAAEYIIDSSRKSEKRSLDRS